ncbi:MAG: apolipoprotein N-acyltransferase [Paracoccus sp. (in: a-proteobacteria)]|nr:apolipoprotein N-acyltransferase [Paracoccus sp. (in: a-proteobacteria)]
MATADSALRRPTRRRLWAGRLCDVALGAVAALGQAPFGLWPLTLIALGLVTGRIMRAPDARAGFGRGWLAGAGYFALALNWIVEPFLVQPEIHGWMAPFAIVLMAAGGGLFWAVPGWLATRLIPVGGSRACGFAMALVLSDWLRGWIFTGFPWALLGHVWIDTPIAQAAAYGGAIGLSALTATAAALPLMLWRDRRVAGLARGAAISALLLASIWAGGTARLNTTAVTTGDITLRLVQPNAEQALKWNPEWARIFWERLLDETAAAPLAGRRPDAVIWPETAVSFLLNYADEALPVIADAAGAPVLMGIQRAEGTRYYNSLIEISAAGEVAQIYDKFHLVPFGEYIPWGDLLARFGIGAFAAQQGFGYTPGPGPALMTPAGLPPAQPLICYEAIFPQHLRAAQGAEWLLQATNDAWFGTWSGPYQHLAQARLRAIESGLPLMRAANTGITAAIDPLGRVTASLPLGAQGHIDVALPAALPRTWWLRLGPGPVLIVVLVALLGAIWRGRRGGSAPGASAGAANPGD